MAPVTANSTTWVNVATIPAGEFFPGHTYLILASACVRHASSANEVRMRLVHGLTPTVFPDSSLAYEVTIDAQETNVGWMYVWTQPGTTELIKIQLSVSASNVATCEVGQVFVLDLTMLNPNGSKYFYTEDLVDYTTTSSKVAKASVTFTPNGSDPWLIIGQAAYLPGSTSSNLLMDLNDSVAGAFAAMAVEGEDTVNEVRGSLLMTVVTPTAASHTFSVRFSHGSTAGTIFSNRIFAINLNAFHQYAFSTAAAQDAPAASPTWTTTRTVAPTPTATDWWFIWGYYSNDVGTITDDVKTRLQVDAAGGGLVNNPAYTASSPGVDSWDATDVLPMNLFTRTMLTAGAPRTCNLDVSMVAGTMLRVQERTLVAFSLKLPAYPLPYRPVGTLMRM